MLEIGHEEEDGKGAFFVDREGLRLAEMTYRRTGPALVRIEHTEADEQLKGLRAGRQMLDAAVAWARETGTRIAATCPFARAQFEKDPSIQDVYER